MGVKYTLTPPAYFQGVKTSSIPMYGLRPARDRTHSNP